MIQIVLHRSLSWVIACSDGMQWEWGDTSHGWQDKSADDCRAHVVGWMAIFVTLGPQQAGSFSEKYDGINDAAASSLQKGEAVP